MRSRYQVDPEVAAALAPLAAMAAEGVELLNSGRKARGMKTAIKIRSLNKFVYPAVTPLFSSLDA